ncbi:MAG: YbhN family protein [Candidatus Omnitrophota bacterium]
MKYLKLLRILVSIFFIFILLFSMRGNFDILITYLKQTEMVYFITAVLLFISIIIILSLRLKKIMEFQGVAISLSNVVYLSLIGFFFNNFLPTSVAGDFVKAYYTARCTNKTMESYTSIVVDRILGVFAFILIAIVALLLADERIKTPIVTNSLISLVVISLFLIFILSNKFISNHLYKILLKTRLLTLGRAFQIFLKTVARFRNNYKIIFFTISTSIISQVISTLVVATLARGLSINLPLILIFLTLPIITTLSMLPSLNGLGIREGAYVFLLGSYIGKEKALAISILWLGVIIVVSIIGGIVYMLRSHFLKESKNNVE